MSKYIDELEFDDLRKDSLLNGIKKYFTQKESINVECNSIDRNFTFRYLEKIKDIEVLVDVSVFLSDDDECLKKIEINCADDRITNLDLESYYSNNIFRDLFKEVARKNEENYCIRVYKYILTDIGFKGVYTVNFGGNKITFKSLLNEGTKSVITERIISFDCLVKAKTIDIARSKAINIVNEFVAYLSVLLDIGFFDIQSKFINVLYTKIKLGEEGVIHEYLPTGFYDRELKLCVRDNMNGLCYSEDYLKKPEVSFVCFGAKRYINNDKSDINQALEKVFKNRELEKANNKQNKFSEKIEEELLFNKEIMIPKCINLYFKGISKLDSEAKKLFFNSCKLYNISRTCGMYEPTLQVSYMVASIDCLLKAEEKLIKKEIRKKGEKKERKSYSGFMKEYLGDNYDKEICDFLYDNIRCGHFHSGESYFAEYDVDLDLMFNVRFQDLFDKFKKGQELLRKAIVRWINRNLINE